MSELPIGTIILFAFLKPENKAKNNRAAQENNPEIIEKPLNQARGCNRNDAEANNGQNDNDDGAEIKFHKLSLSPPSKPKNLPSPEVA
jgi:hypothetical protein